MGKLKTYIDNLKSFFTQVGEDVKDLRDNKVNDFETNYNTISSTTYTYDAIKIKVEKPSMYRVVLSPATAGINYIVHYKKGGNTLSSLITSVSTLTINDLTDGLEFYITQLGASTSNPPILRGYVVNFFSGLGTDFLNNKFSIKRIF